MRYLGNKTQHLDFIYEAVKDIIDKNHFESPVICDAFGGTGAVTHFFNLNNFRIISNDINNYAYYLCYSRNCITEDDIKLEGIGMTLEECISYLNKCRHKGFVYENYSPNPSMKYERRF